MKNFKSLLTKRWIFVGGKGGVGKTSTSCALALSLSSIGHKVLLISTDPAHNLSDAFGQKFSHIPSLAESTENLYCMEIDPSRAVSALFSTDSSSPDSLSNFSSEAPNVPSKKGAIKRILSFFPGIDEAVTFHILITDKSLDKFDKIIFDTAPTGHTLKFLGLPETLDLALKELLTLKSKFGPILTSLKLFSSFNKEQTNSNSTNGQSENSLQNDLLSIADENIFDKLSNIKKSIEEIKSLFQDKTITTFVCVSIPEMMSLYETERLINGVKRFDIGCGMIVINQIIMGSDCRICGVRGKIHEEFVEQFEVLYGEDFELVKVPVMDFEVRGVESLKKLGDYIMRQNDK